MSFKAREFIRWRKKSECMLMGWVVDCRCSTHLFFKFIYVIVMERFGEHQQRRFTQARSILRSHTLTFSRRWKHGNHFHLAETGRHTNKNQTETWNDAKSNDQENAIFEQLEFQLIAHALKFNGFISWCFAVVENYFHSQCRKELATQLRMAYFPYFTHTAQW